MDPCVVTSPSSGVLSGIDRDRLIRLARDADCVFEVAPAFGVFVPAGAALVRVSGRPSAVDHDAVVSALTLSLERTLDEDAYVHLVFDEVRLAGASSPQVSRRLVSALDDLLSVAPVARRPALEEQMRLLRRQVAHLPRDERDRQRARRPDAQGLGVAASSDRIDLRGDAG